MVNKKIVCLGWGSLIWDNRDLNLKSNWQTDGPFLPIEFSRISLDKRITLIIDTDASSIQTLWADLNYSTYEDAFIALKKREGIQNDKHIGVVDIQNKKKSYSNLDLSIMKWAKEKDIDCVLYTNLSYSQNTNYQRPKIELLIQHIKDNIANSELSDSIENYIRKAPKQITTEYRKHFEKEFGWTPI